MTERWIVARMILLAGFSGLAFYIMNQVLRYSDWGWPAYLITIFWICSVFGLALSQPMFMWGKEKYSDSVWAERLNILSYLAIVYVSDIVILVMLRDFVGFPMWAGYYWGLWTWDGWDLYTPTVSFILLFLPLAMLGSGYLVILAGPFHKKITVEDARIPKAFDGYVLAHVSDIHFGPMMFPFLGRRILKKLKAAKYDALMMTGDIIDCDPNWYPSEVSPVMELWGNDGSYYCPGNHEYYWGLEKALKPLRAAGVEVLINRSKEIEKSGQKLRIWGAPDPISKYMPNTEAFDWAKVKPPGDGAYEILLVHQPHLADEARHHGFHLQLSGHTHSGQFFPWNLLIVFFQKYSKGMYRIRKGKKAKPAEDDMWLYVNQGTGFWGPPTRLGTYAEITLITLRSKA